MSFDKGFDFRSTSGFITDPTNCTYSIQDAYPQTRNGVTFGWTSGPTDARDRGTAADVRLAGINFQTNNGTQSTFQVDLPSAADYIITLALGDRGSAQGYQYIKFLDNSTLLATIDDTDGTGDDTFDDATGVQRTDANWPSQNATITKTFATTTFKLVLGSPASQASSSTIAHLFLSQVSGGTTTTIAPPEGATVYGGLTPALQLALAPTVGAINYGGNNPSINLQLTPSVGAEVYTGQTPSLSQSFVLFPTEGAVVFGGLIPSLTFQVAGQEGRISYDGNAPSISQTGGSILHFSRRHGRVYYQ